MQELAIEAGRTERHFWRDTGRHRELLCFIGVFRPPLLLRKSCLALLAKLKSTAEVSGLVAGGVGYLRKVERSFADVI